MLIVAFGDSITQCADQPEAARWTALLAGLLPGARIMNAGFGGNTSREGLARLDKDVLQHGPDVVLVEFGGNDATPEKERHVEGREFVANLEQICDAVVSVGGRVVLLTFPPIINEWHGWCGNALFENTGGPDGFIERYREATRAFAQERNLELIDIDLALRAAMARDGKETYIQRDGVHLTAAGNRLVAHVVVEHLKAAYDV